MKIDYIQNIINCYEPMAIFHDLAVAASILERIDPQTIIEFGTGNAGWLLSLDHILSNDRKFIGVDNFGWNYGLPWATNASQLLDIVQQQSSNKNISIIDQDVNHIDTDWLDRFGVKFDTVRLDCLETPEDISRFIDIVIPYTSDKCIWLVDDIAPNISPERWLSFMEKVFQGVLKPIWFGNKEGAWCRNDFDCSGIQQSIQQLFSAELRFYKRDFRGFPVIQTQ